MDRFSDAYDPPPRDVPSRAEYEDPPPKLVRFVKDDPYGLWKAGDEAEDLGPESEGLPLLVLRLRRGGLPEIITLTDPYGRGLIEEIEDEREAGK